MEKEDQILKRLRELANPEMNEDERNLSLLRMVGSIAADIRILSAKRWEARRQLSDLTGEISKDRANMLILVTDETDPNTNKKLYTNSDMREAEVDRRLATDDVHTTLVDDARALENQIAVEYDIEIDYRVSINRVINSYLLSKSNLDRHPIH